MLNNSSASGKWSEVPWADGNLCPPSLSGTTFLIVAYSTVIAVGLVGNVCLVFIISRQKEMRNVTNILIANLSCSDILMCLVCLPVTVIYTLMDRWILGEALCKVTPFVQCMSVTVSIFSLVLIALERHQLIIHPTGWTPAAGHSYLAVAVTWMVACFISLPFLSFNILTNSPFQNLSIPFNPFSDHVICMELWPSERNRLAYTTSLLLFQYCLPLLLILLCYLRIFLRLRRRKDMLEQASEIRQRKARGAQRINAMLASIVVAFALCWLPLNIFNTLFDWYHQALPSCQHDIIFSACHLTAMASTCVNPVVYGFLNSNFQKELKNTLHRCRCWGTPESYESFPLSTVGMDVTKMSSMHRGSFATIAEHGIHS
ncbi:neuropeptide Y receptor Y8a [Denticeps clupeoides]|uniref:G-protein coupled receptors family 1 profile domain-containing protein n=1 Tax=Denticeps clupeoides TaxID=299321 RepID=A0AAY4E420_9TELE|nr:neuropeptide Y receptor type 6-like [Denticeps clupeoides]XP_028829148.1 neuropeptide Y receptor type 6-like [Denticeps clupeoides]